MDLQSWTSRVPILGETLNKQQTYWKFEGFDFSHIFRGFPYNKNTVHGLGWCHIMTPKRNGDIGGSRNRWDGLR